MSTTPRTDDNNNDKVADAIKHSWVYYLPRWLWSYAQLARWERPIGWQLLMWPCWWSAVLAVIYAQHQNTRAPAVFPDFSTVLFNVQKTLPLSLTVLLPLFLGAFLMRGAGCTYNDLADIDIDNQVERTRSRPLPSGRVSKKQAIAFLLLQVLGGLFVLIFLSRQSSSVFMLGCCIFDTCRDLSVYETHYLVAATFSGAGIFMGSLDGLDHHLA